MNVDYTLWGYMLYCTSMREDIKKQVQNRLRRIEGQIRGLQKMVENDTYCIDVITQTSAVKQALTSVEDAMLENHLSTHAIEQMKSGKEKKAIDEVLKVYRLAQRKK